MDANRLSVYEVGELDDVGELPAHDGDTVGVDGQSAGDEDETACDVRGAVRMVGADGCENVFCEVGCSLRYGHIRRVVVETHVPGDRLHPCERFLIRPRDVLGRQLS